MNFNLYNTIKNPYLDKYYLRDNKDGFIEDIKSTLNKNSKMFKNIDNISTLGVYTTDIPKSNIQYADNALMYIFYFKFNDDNLIRKYKIRILTDDNGKRYWHGYIYGSYIIKHDNWINDIPKKYKKIY